MSAPTPLPMFPLGSVLFPTMVLPLHVFEPRYRALVADCLAGDQEFGVCLIERGFEVGGGDERTAVGTVAQIVDAQRFDDGRWALAAVGTRRFKVVDWLPDDPYPRALVEDWIDEPLTEDLSADRNALVESLRRVLMSQADLGEPAPPVDVEIDADPTLACYQVATLSPLGPFDRHQVLATATTPERIALLRTLLGETLEVLEARRRLG